MLRQAERNPGRGAVGAARPRRVDARRRHRWPGPSRHGSSSQHRRHREHSRSPRPTGVRPAAWRRPGHASPTATTSLEELHRELAASAWGDPGSWRDRVCRRVGWLRMVARSASDGLSAVGRWVAPAALVVARRVVALSQYRRSWSAATPLIGARWSTARSMSDCGRLPPTARWGLADVEPAGLWLAEARLRGTVESDGFRMLRSPRSGPAGVRALAVLAVDGWRVRAALACAAAEPDRVRCSMSWRDGPNRPDGAGGLVAPTTAFRPMLAHVGDVGLVGWNRPTSSPPVRRSWAAYRPGGGSRARDAVVAGHPHPRPDCRTNLAPWGAAVPLTPPRGVRPPTLLGAAAAPGRSTCWSGPTPRCPTQRGPDALAGLAYVADLRDVISATSVTGCVDSRRAAREVGGSAGSCRSAEPGRSWQGGAAAMVFGFLYGEMFGPTGLIRYSGSLRRRSPLRCCSRQWA
jgi:hypothetical protein